jgi:hypothetical protein
MTEKPLTQFVNELYMRARIMGGHVVIMALDRIACPSLNLNGAKLIKEAMVDLQNFSMHLEPDERKRLQVMIAQHMKTAIEKAKPTPAAAEEEKEA